MIKFSINQDNFFSNLSFNVHFFYLFINIAHESLDYRHSELKKKLIYIKIVW